MPSVPNSLVVIGSSEARLRYPGPGFRRRSPGAYPEYSSSRDCSPFARCGQPRCSRVGVGAASGAGGGSIVTVTTIGATVIDRSSGSGRRAWTVASTDPWRLQWRRSGLDRDQRIERLPGPCTISCCGAADHRANLEARRRHPLEQRLDRHVARLEPLELDGDGGWLDADDLDLGR